jgi:hypothetical protein
MQSLSMSCQAQVTREILGAHPKRFNPAMIAPSSSRSSRNTHRPRPLEGPPGRQCGRRARMDGPRDPFASADFGMNRAAPDRARDEARTLIRPPKPPMRSDEPPICGDPPAGLAHSWTSKSGPWAPSIALDSIGLAPSRLARA